MMHELYAPFRPHAPISQEALAYMRHEGLAHLRPAARSPRPARPWRRERATALLAALTPRRLRRTP